MEKSEIELKFIFDGDSSIYEDCQKKHIHQSYISIHPETRLRRVETENDVKFFLTTKTDGDLSRDEFEVEIAESTYNDLKQHIVGNEIIKTRYKVPVTQNDAIYMADVDIFESEDLATVEVEFPNKTKALSFIEPSWFGKDITINPVYKNKYIALYGLDKINSKAN